MTTSLARPTPAGSPASTAPAATNRSTGSRLRCAQTLTANQARNNEAAIGSPMAPAPISPTCVTRDYDLTVEAV
jgi:hypothetical protein